MHVHLFSDGDEYPNSIAQDELKVMVANGVTTVRFMIGTHECGIRCKCHRTKRISPHERHARGWL